MFSAVWSKDVMDHNSGLVQVYFELTVKYVHVQRTTWYAKISASALGDLLMYTYFTHMHYLYSVGGLSRATSYYSFSDYSIETIGLRTKAPVWSVCYRYYGP
jgi:hypothetical protein